MREKRCGGDVFQRNTQEDLINTFQEIKISRLREAATQEIRK